MPIDVTSDTVIFVNEGVTLKLKELQFTDENNVNEYSSHNRKL
jgi:hypothetical protein